MQTQIHNITRKKIIGENTHLLSEVSSFPRFQRSYFVTILTPLKHACKQDSKSQTIYRRAYSYLDTLEISAIDLLASYGLTYQIVFSGIVGLKASFIQCGLMTNRDYVPALLTNKNNLAANLHVSCRNTK